MKDYRGYETNRARDLATWLTEQSAQGYGDPIVQVLPVEHGDAWLVAIVSRWYERSDWEKRRKERADVASAVA